ncbi:TonB-dependent receptor [Burkholderia sp. L27(2015)]|uniref:TonB-dependent receptor n=1 Tax=Burkholderia sp. L27(2015) TaxID=1641858 RepID=UPI00131B95B2|nr:TonB-dependent receptor [Burkholderia sp. L27(2015)]
MSRRHPLTRRKRLTTLILATLSATALNNAHAQSTTDLGSVQSSATTTSTNDGTPAKQASAAYQAPTQGSLIATQPQSIISQHYIENNAAPTANYSDIIQISPSVSDIDPNGPGLMESQGLSIRGFTDGQYNVTFDGVPWGDSNDFTHHSTSYFTSQNIGSVTVDRGPGDARTVGDATFGGTISIQSKDPSTVATFTPSISYGSWNTLVAGATYNTGVLPQLGDARAMFSYSQTTSDGYLTDANQQRQNYFVKLEKPIGDDTLVTFVATYNHVHQNVSVGATKAQIAQFGPDFGLNNDPTSQAFSGYNTDDIHTDFEYLGVQTRVSSWHIDNKLYTYAYYHSGFNGEDPNGETPNGTVFGANNVPGQHLLNDYRSVGDIFKASREVGPGTLTLGAWVDHQVNTRSLLEIDDTLGGVLNGTQASATDRAQNDTLLTLQPFVEYEWKLPFNLSLDSGLKYVSFKRDINADVNQGTGEPLVFGHTFSKLLPSLALHERINSNWSAYAQYAKGYLAPNLNVFFVPDPTVSGQPDPEETDNYQIGTTYKSDRLTASADIYYINFINAVESRTVGGQTEFFNAGGAIYKGIETEATYYLGQGFSLYGNLTFNDAKQKGTDDWLPNAPNKTAAAGVIYERGPLYSSLIMKFVGHEFGDTGNTQPIGGFAVTNFAAAYTFKQPTTWMRNTRVGFQVYNLFNRTSIDALAGFTAADNTPLYWTVPGRAFTVTLSTDF